MFKLKFEFLTFWNYEKSENLKFDNLKCVFFVLKYWNAEIWNLKWWKLEKKTNKTNMLRKHSCCFLVFFENTTIHEIWKLGILKFEIWKTNEKLTIEIWNFTTLNIWNFENMKFNIWDVDKLNFENLEILKFEIWKFEFLKIWNSKKMKFDKLA